MLRYRGDNSGIDAQKPIFYIFRSRTPLGFFRYLLISSVVSVSWTIFFLFSKFKRLGLSQVGVLSGVAMQEIWNSKLLMMSQASSFGLQDGKLTIFLTNFRTASWVQFPDRSIDQNYGKSGTSGRSNLAQRGKLALPNDYAVVAIGED